MNFYRDAWVEVNLDAIIHNVEQIKQHYVKDKQLIAVVKADGYGHGAVMVAKTVLKAGANCLAVATLDEAIELRNHKIKAPILVLGNIQQKYIAIAAKYHVTITVHHLKWLKQAVKLYKGKKVDLHLKLDTGMHRIGLLTKDEVKQAVDMINQHGNFCLKGVFTHMASSEVEDESYYQIQLNKFELLLENIDTRNLMIHLANSAATIRYSDHLTNAVRVGLLLYGLIPAKHMTFAFEVKQAIGLYAHVIHCKSLEKGSLISYNGIYETKQSEWIGTLAIGYADGWDRRMVDANVYVNETLCPVVGRICMDQTMFKLDKEVEIGTRVELIGPHISVDTVAKRLKTINYQVVCLLSDRLPRVYKQNNKITHLINRRIK